MRIDNLYDVAVPSKPANRDRPTAVFVRAARKKMEKTQSEFGRLLGREKANISAWERGAHEPSFDQMAAISKFSGEPLPAAIARSSAHVAEEPSPNAYVEAINNEASLEPYRLLEQALHRLVIVGDDHDEIVALVKVKAEKSRRMQEALKDRLKNRKGSE